MICLIKVCFSANKKIFFLFLFIGFLLNAELFSQSLSDKKPELVPVSQVIIQLESLHSVKIFYDSSLFINDSLPGDVIYLPLEQSIRRILGTRNLEAIGFQGNLVILPLEESAPNLPQPQDNQRLIGNLFEFGRYTRASITGQVLDGKTGEELIGVLVYAEDLGRGTTTNMEGVFNLELPVGEHSLTVSYIGYEPYVIPIRLVSPGELNIQLMEESRLLDGVTITARRHDSNVSMTQMSVVRMDAKTLAQLPTPLGERDIIKSLTLLPGVQTVGEFGTGFHVRGGSADQNLVLVEGVPLFNTSHLFGLTSLINPDVVADVTLIKAGIPARYGERSSSVMDIKLGGREDNRVFINGGIGLLSSRLSLQAPLPIDNGYILLGGRSSYSNLMLSQMPDEDLMNSSANFYDLSALVYSPINKRNNISIFGYYSKDGFSFNDNMEYKYASTLGSIRWNSVFSDRVLSSFLIGYSGYSYLVTEEKEMNPLNDYGLESDINYQNLRWNLSFFHSPGINFETGLNASFYDNLPGHLFALGERSTVRDLKLNSQRAAELAGYISTSIDISEKIAVEAGLRFTQYLRLGPGVSRIYEDGRSGITDSISYRNNEIMASFNGLEPRLSLRYQFDQRSSIKMSYSRINQYINLVSNTSVSNPSDVWYLADEHQAPLISDQLAMGYFKNFFENTLEASFEVYYKGMQNVMEPRNNATIIMNPALEADLLNVRGHSYGAEVYVKKSAGIINGWLSYTYSRSFLRTNGSERQDQINSNAYFPSNYDKPHNLVINSNVQLDRRWRLGATFSYSTGRPVTYPELVFVHDGKLMTYFSDRNKYRLPDYHRLDLSISFDGSLRTTRSWKSYWTISLVNVYGRKNIYSSFYEQSEPSQENNYQRYSLYKLYVIGRPLPSITYNFTF
jgi:hypothetical protein